MPLTPQNPDETVERAEDIYNHSLRQQVEFNNRGKYIAIDVESSDFEVGPDYHAAAHKLLERNPKASIAVLRIGFAAVGRIGGRFHVAQQ